MCVWMKITFNHKKIINKNYTPKYIKGIEGDKFKRANKVNYQVRWAFREQIIK